MTKAASYLLFCAVSYAQNSVATYHNDNERTGQYLSEKLLTPANVKAGLFGKRFTLSVDGEIYGQPLYLPRVNIAGHGLHNVLFVTSAHDSVYAFDADDESSTGAQPLWQVNFLDASKGVGTVSSTDVNCPVIPELGIAGTPVIDAASGTLRHRRDEGIRRTVFLPPACSGCDEWRGTFGQSRSHPTAGLCRATS